MKENARKFLELASKDEALKQELAKACTEAAKGKDSKEAATEAALEASAKIAAAHGHNMKTSRLKKCICFQKTSLNQLQAV